MNLRPVILKSKVNAEGKTNIKIRVIHKGKVREIATKFYIVPDEFKKNQVTDDNPNYKYINLELKKIILEYEKRLLDVNTDQKSISQIVDFLRKDIDKNKDNSFIDYFEYFIEKKKKRNKRTAEIYQTTLNKITNEYIDLAFGDINLSWLREFNDILQGLENKTNTRAIDFRNIRSVINSAIDDDIIGLEFYPFRKFKIEKEETKMRNLTVEQLKGIRDFKSDNKKICMARDFFMLSFYLIGTNIVDILEATEIKKGRLEFKRRKTKRKYSILVPKEAMEIIKNNPGKEKLLSWGEGYSDYRYFTKIVNKKLNIIGKEIKEPDLTTYYARYSFASLAAELEIPKETIAAALGHGKKSTTDIYINFDMKKVDEANRNVLDLLK